MRLKKFKSFEVAESRALKEQRIASFFTWSLDWCGKLHAKAAFPITIFIIIINHNNKDVALP
jgi:hypothetical protein